MMLCVLTLHASNLSAAINRPGAMAEKAEQLKSTKFSSLDSSYLFTPVAIVGNGVLRTESMCFIRDLGC